MKMEEWNKANKMIRSIGEKQDPFEYTDVSRERLRTLEQLLSTHIKWFTHKNPYGCSICDLLNLTETILQSFESFLGPSEGTGGQDTLVGVEEKA